MIRKFYCEEFIASALVFLVDHVLMYQRLLVVYVSK